MSGYPKVGTYHSLGNSSTILGDGHGNPNRPNIAKLARWDDCVIDLGPAIEQPRIIAALRAANPAIGLHAYVVMKVYDWPGAFFQEMLATVTALNGFLYKVDGSMWEPNVNLARPDVVEALAKVIAKYLPGWDALFLDVFPALMQNVAASGINFERAGFTTEKAFSEAWAQGHAALPQAIRYHAQRPDLPISGNAGPSSHADVNGWMRENFPAQNGGTWESNCLEYVTPAWVAPGLLREVYREPRASWICTQAVMSRPVEGKPAIYDPHHPENLRRHRYGLASACLGGAFYSFGRYEGDAQWCRERLDFWYPEYCHPRKGYGWLGKPIGPAEHVISEKGKTVDLWIRDFQHGIVIVNPSSTAHSYYTGEQRYQPIGGTAKTAFSVPAHDALLLEAV